MQVPLLKQGAILIATLQPSLTDTDFVALGKELLTRVGVDRIKGVIVDVGSLDVIDSFSARTLRNIADTVGLRGARMVVVGIQPEIAFSMVQLGLTLQNTWTALDLDDGLILLEQGAQGRPDVR